MRSRVPVVIGAWLLGAFASTGGSLLAVDQLGQGLLEQHAKQVSVAAVNAELALANFESTSAAPAASHSATANASSAAARVKKSAPPPTSGTGRLLTSSGGTAVATCEHGRARLLYWSPGQGFAVFRVKRGPSQVGSVTFTDSSGGVVMHVACGTSGVPAAHNSTFNRRSGVSHPDD